MLGTCVASDRHMHTLQHAIIFPPEMRASLQSHQEGLAEREETKNQLGLETVGQALPHPLPACMPPPEIGDRAK